MKIAISISEAGKAKGKERAYVDALLAAGARPEEIEVVTELDASRDSGSVSVTPWVGSLRLPS